MPGCLDFTNWWVGEVPERYRQREFFQYNVEILLMRTNAEEFAALGQLMGERLRAAKGPGARADPARRLQRAHRRARRTISAGSETGPWAQPGNRSRVRRCAARAIFAGGAIKELPHHINDAAFADACVDELAALLKR